MKFTIVHETPGRLRLRAAQRFMTLEEADLLEATIRALPGVETVTVHERSAGVILRYHGPRDELLHYLAAFSYEHARADQLPVEHSSRQLSREYQEKITLHVARYALRRLFIPAPIRRAICLWQSLPFLKRGLLSLLHLRFDVRLLDALAIGVSMLRGDFPTASSVIFLQRLGDYLEEWTHKKSVSDLARSMALHIDRVWLVTEGADIEVPLSQVRAGDTIRVHHGCVIPLDGELLSGEVLVNQSSLTGESVPVARRPGARLYAGTVLEEGDALIRVTEASGGGKYDQIVRMIEDSQRLQSVSEQRAASMADKLVPYTILGSLLTYALTRNSARAASVLMVDFSCALKLAMPLSVLSAMREAGRARVTVKGGKYLEALSKADTVILDKTGTLTNACPTVVDVVPFGGGEPDELLRIAACLEEHFPHSMANAVVTAARRKGLLHNEMHSTVEYIVAHGIASHIGEERVLIGSRHFVLEDEHVTIPEGEEARFEALPAHFSQLLLAIGGVLRAVICISDPLRAEAAEAVRALHESGISRVVMLTGDSEHTAAAIAREVGVDDFRAEVLPGDKADFIRAEQAAGRTVVMVGDGINDAPALSYADVGVAIGSGAAIAREVADITISADDLRALAYLRRLSTALMGRIGRNYRFIMSFNSALIALGAVGILPAAVSALLHNASTIGLSLDCMTDLLNE